MAVASSIRLEGASSPLPPLSSEVCNGPQGYTSSSMPSVAAMPRYAAPNSEAAAHLELDNPGTYAYCPI